MLGELAAGLRRKVFVQLTTVTAGGRLVDHAVGSAAANQAARTSARGGPSRLSPPADAGSKSATS